MRQVDEVYSSDGNVSLRICHLADDTYMLQRFEKRYDEEEAVSFWIHSLPDPVGRYSNAEIALAEARRIIDHPPIS